jgi:hypothetical protein
MTPENRRRAHRWGAPVGLLLVVTYAASNIDTIALFCTKTTRLKDCWSQESSPVIQLIIVAAFVAACIGWSLLGLGIQIAAHEPEPWRKRSIWVLGALWAVGSMLWYLPMHFIAAANQPDSLHVLQSWPGILGSIVACVCLGTTFETFIGGNIIEKW